MRSGIKKKIAGLGILVVWVVLIFSILTPPGTAVNLGLSPGNLTLEDRSVYEGATVTFTDINFTVGWTEKDLVNFLNFSIFDDADDNCVAFVTFSLDGTKNDENTLGNFTVTNTAITGGGLIYFGYSTMRDNMTYLYDISYTTHKIGTFYAKLFVNSTSHSYESSKSTTFTVYPPDGFLFDVELELTYDSVFVGENNTAIIDLTNVGEIGLVNATLNRTLYFGDEVIWSVEEDISISGHTSFSAGILTDELEPGVYTYKVVHSYGSNQTASASSTFTVMTKAVSTTTEEFPWIVIVLIVIVIIILILVYLFMSGHLYVIAMYEAKYIAIYKQSDQIKSEQLLQALHGYTDDSNDGTYKYGRKGVLDGMDYWHPLKGVYILETKRDADKLIEIFEEYDAKYYVGKIKFLTEDKQQDSWQDSSTVE